MASPPPLSQQPAPAISFFPQDHELVLQYLRPKLAGSPLPVATKHFFHHTDLYATEPSTLASLYPPGPARTFGESENWYFFCPMKPKIARDGRKPRIVADGKGTWKAERGKDVFDTEGSTVGRLERFTYVPKPKEEGKPPEWLMVEFSVAQEQEDGAVVLCKMYQSPRFLSKSASKSSSSSASARKRKAADVLPVPDLSPSTSLSASARKKSIKATNEPSPAVKRQLLFPSPPAPILQDDDSFLGDDQFWSEFLSDPFPCSMTAASSPFFSGMDFGSSIAAP